MIPTDSIEINDRKFKNITTTVHIEVLWCKTKYIIIINKRCLYKHFKRIYIYVCRYLYRILIRAYYELMTSIFVWSFRYSIAGSNISYTLRVYNISVCRINALTGSMHTKLYNIISCIDRNILRNRFYLRCQYNNDIIMTISAVTTGECCGCQV